MARQSKLWLGLRLGSVLVIFVGLGSAVMYRLGFFSLNGSDASSKVVAAALTLVGVVIGTVVSFFGVLLKHSIDARNADLRTDAEQRLKLEAAVRTLQLFSTAAGEPAPRDQRDGALVTLSSLGQYEITLLIAEKLIVNKDLDPNLFTTLLNGAILHGSEDIKEGAITLYHRYANSMLIEHGIAVPRALLMWQRGLSESVRERGAIAIAKAIMARPFAKWIGNNLRFNFYTAVGILCLAWEKEKTRRLRDNFAVILYSLSSAMPAADYLYHPSKKINLAKIKREVKGAEADSEYMKSLATQLLDWVNRKDGEKQVTEATQSKDSDKEVPEPEQSKDSNKQRRAHRQGR